MYKNTEEKSEKIVSLYREGVTLTQISKLTSSSQLTIKKVLLNFGIDYNQELKASKEKTLEKVLSLYKEGKSQSYIEKTLRVTRKTIREVLKSSDIIYRNKSDQGYITYSTKVNHNAFDELTPESLYWIGLIYTDGHVSQTKDASIEVSLHANDVEHLEKLRLFLKSNRKIVNGHNCKRFRVNSYRLRNKLLDLGFTSNKSISIKPHELLKNSRDFWRGCVDGDGGLYNHPSGSSIIPHLFLCGTLETVFDFIIFCSKNSEVKEKYPTKAKGNNHFRVSYYGNDARKISELLYKDSTIYLDRKYQKYLNGFI